jgi:hypothetical protein
MRWIGYYDHRAVRPVENADAMGSDLKVNGIAGLREDSKA